MTAEVLAAAVAADGAAAAMQRVLEWLEAMRAHDASVSAVVATALVESKVRWSVRLTLSGAENGAGQIPFGHAAAATLNEAFEEALKQITDSLYVCHAEVASLKERRRRVR